MTPAQRTDLLTDARRIVETWDLCRALLPIMPADANGDDSLPSVARRLANGVQWLDAEANRLRAIIQAQADGCRECRGTVRAPAWGYSPAIEGPTIVGTEPCPACRWAREALEGKP